MAADRIIDGLNDALAFAQGDTTRGKVVWPSGWQPIETAPRDGTDILVCVTHNTPDGDWETIQWVDWAKGRIVWPIYRDRIDIPLPPTNWQPLPPPPEAS